MPRLTINDFSMALTGAALPGQLGEQPVHAIAYDSREVLPGTLFFCKGKQFQPAYLTQAHQKGAIACVVQADRFADLASPEDLASGGRQLASLPCIQVPSIRPVLSQAAALFYDHPEEKLTLFAVTGTKGKTTTIAYLFSILDQAAKREGKRAGAISSAFIFDGEKERPARLSTPEPFELFAILAACVDHGVQNLALEVSSQALKQGRTRGLTFAMAGFTNIGHDHISPLEHPNFEDYFSSKLKIFDQCQTAFVNLDADYCDRICQAAKAADRQVYVTCQPKNSPRAAYACLDIKEQAGLQLTFRDPQGTQLSFHMQSLGAFNAANALMAYAMAREAGIPDPVIIQALSQVRVPGRMEAHYSSDGRLMILVDYAHNGISFQSLFQDLEAQDPQAYTIALWGAYGDKALNRRQETGELAGRYADENVVTTVGYSQEDPAAIIQEIGSYIEGVGGQWIGEVDRIQARELAYQQALKALEDHDHVQLLLLGKGAEDYITLAGEPVPFQPETEVACELMARYEATCADQSGEAKRTL